MRFRRELCLFVLVVLAVCFLLGFLPPGVVAQPSFTVHNLNTGYSYVTVQEALDDSATLNGHVIQVDTSTHYEHVNVSKAVSIVGENALNTVIDGQGNGTVITVQASNVMIAGFTVRNSGSVSGSAGVHVVGSGFCNVSGNIVQDNWYGIWLESCSSPVVSGNNFTDNSNAVYADSATDGSVSNNIFSMNDFAVWLNGVNATGFQSNNVSRNNYGVWIAKSANLSLSENWIANNSDGVRIYDGSDSVELSDNTIYANSSYAVFMDGCSNSGVTGNHVSSRGKEALYVQNSHRNNLTGNTVASGGYDGIYLGLSSRNSLDGNIVTEGKNAIELYSSVDNVVSGNDLSRSTYGIVLRGSDRNEILQNRVLGNDYGISVTNSRSVNVEGNNFTGNVKEGIRLTLSSSGELTDNSVSDSIQAITLTNSPDNLVSNNSVSDCATGIDVEGSADDSLVGNNVSGGTVGVLLLNSRNITAVNNDLWDNGAGFLLNMSDNNFVYDNRLTRNVDGVRLQQSKNNTMELNTVSQNVGRGIYVSYSDHNVMLHNGFFNNSLGSVSLNSSNSWDDGVEGNFWGYEGFVDADRNGVADSPFVLGDNEKDNFPLMAQYVELSTVVDSRKYVVGIVCNSSASDLRFVRIVENASALITFRVSEVEGIIFCRTGIPHAMVQAPFEVTIDNDKPSYLNVVGSNGTHSWLYFSFPLGGDVRIAAAAPAPPFWAEFWFWGIAVLGIVVAVLTLAIFLFYRRLSAYRKTMEEVERKLREREFSPLEVARRLFSSDVERRSVKIGKFEEKYGIKIRPRESLDDIFRGLEFKEKKKKDDEVNS